MNSPASGKPAREKISVIAHMGGQDRVNFKMYCDQEFRQVSGSGIDIQKTLPFFLYLLKKDDGDDQHEKSKSHR